MEKFYVAPVEYYRHFLEHPGASVANIVLQHNEKNDPESVANARFILGLDNNPDYARAVERIGNELRAYEQSGTTMSARWSTLNEIYFRAMRIGSCKQTDEILLSFLAETACSSMLGRNPYWLANSLQMFARMAGYSSYTAIPGLKVERRENDKGLRVGLLKEASSIGKIRKYCTRYQSEKLRREVDCGFNGMRLYSQSPYRGFIILDEEALGIYCDDDLKPAVQRIFDRNKNKDEATDSGLNPFP